MKKLARKLSWGLSAAAMITASNARSATQDVAITGFAFQPPSVSINAGDSVRWTDMDNASHTSTSDTGVWDSGVLNLTQFSFQFTNAGNYPYHCTTHPFMTASVSVTASSNQPPTVSITSPTNGASFTAPATVAINATASDTDGSVTN